MPRWRADHVAAKRQSRRLSPAPGRDLTELSYRSICRKNEPSRHEQRVRGIPRQFRLFSDTHLDAIETGASLRTPSQVATAMQVVEGKLVYCFYTAGHFSIARDQEFDGFGGVSRVRLLAGYDLLRPQLRQIRAIEVEVALVDEQLGLPYPESVALAGLPAEKAMTAAVNAATHVIAVLRSHRVPIRRYSLSPGDPCQDHVRVWRRFGDGSELECAGLDGGLVGIGESSLTSASLASPLNLRSDAFHATWDDARNELALRYTMDHTEWLDAAKRNILVLESHLFSELSDKPLPGELSARLQGHECLALLEEAETTDERLVKRRVELGLEREHLGEHIVSMRHELSHLQRYASGQIWGCEVYEKHANPVYGLIAAYLGAMADIVISRRLGRDVRAPASDRRASCAELLELMADHDYAEQPGALRVLRSRLRVALESEVRGTAFDRALILLVEDGAFDDGLVPLCLRNGSPRSREIAVAQLVSMPEAERSRIVDRYPESGLMAECQALIDARGRRPS